MADSASCDLTASTIVSERRRSRLARSRRRRRPATTSSPSGRRTRTPSARRSPRSDAPRATRVTGTLRDRPLRGEQRPEGSCPDDDVATHATASRRVRPGTASSSARVYSWVGSASTRGRRALLEQASRAAGRRPRAPPGRRRRGRARRARSRRRGRCCSRASRRSTWSCTETSSAETGSSRYSSSGSIASARAIATRWRCPPDSSDGRRVAASVGSADEIEQLGDPRPPRGARADAERHERLGDAAADREPRVERRERVLLHQLEPATQRPRLAPARARRRRRRRRRTRPGVGFSSPSAMRSRVVLPEPDSPTIASVRPARASSVTSSSGAKRGGCRSARRQREVLGDVLPAHQHRASPPALGGGDRPRRARERRRPGCCV